MQLKSRCITQNPISIGKGGDAGGDSRHFVSKLRISYCLGKWTCTFYNKSWYHSVAPIYSWKGLEKCAIGQELADLKCGAFDMSETFARISGIDVMDVLVMKMPKPLSLFWNS